jgi:hypothetical protein
VSANQDAHSQPAGIELDATKPRGFVYQANAPVVLWAGKHDRKLTVEARRARSTFSGWECDALGTSTFIRRLNPTGAR